MVCPHCLTAYHPQAQIHPLGNDINCAWQLKWETCPNCKKFVMRLLMLTHSGSDLGETVVYPKGASRKPLSPEVPTKLAGDYKEACLVIQDSPKASAALSRRCLQAVLREHAKVQPRDLSKEIDEVLASNCLPSHLASAVDAVRHVGNFAAHPIKSTASREIIDVEPGEAEWLLDVLEGLFDFYFVAPAELQKKRDALNAKLAEAGKPPLK